MFVLFVLLLIIVLIIFYFYAIYFGLFFGGPFIPVSKRDIKHLAKVFNFKKEDVVYELGSGDARILIYLARKYKIKSVGIEINFLLSFWSKLKIKFLGLDRFIKIKRKSFFQENLKEADVIICYLMPKAMKNLREKFTRELKLGTKIISFSFSIPNWKPIIVDKPSKKDKTIYIYEVGKTTRINADKDADKCG